MDFTKGDLKNNLKAFEPIKSYFLFITGMVMALVHLESGIFSFGEGYYPSQLLQNIFYYNRFVAYFNIAIPCIAAMNYFTIYYENKSNPRFKLDYLKTLFKLFIILLIAENLIEIIMNLPNLTLDFYSFAVLQFTGISLILLHLIVCYLGWVNLFLITLMILLTTPFVWIYFRFSGLLVLSGSNNYEFQWPLFPWLAIPFSGFLISYLWVTKPNLQKYFFYFSTLMFLVLFFWTRNNIFIDLSTRWGDAVFQPHISLVYQNIFFIPLLLYISSCFSKYRLIRRYDIVDVVSRGIFFFYIIHLIFSEYVFVKILNKSWIYHLINSEVKNINVLMIFMYIVILYIILIFFTLMFTKFFLKIFIDNKIIEKVNF